MNYSARQLLMQRGWQWHDAVLNLTSALTGGCPECPVWPGSDQGLEGKGKLRSDTASTQGSQGTRVRQNLSLGPEPA